MVWVLELQLNLNLDLELKDHGWTQRQPQARDEFHLVKDIAASVA